jgi:type II secretory pathway component PulF
VTTLLAAHKAVVDSERRAAFYRSWQAAFGMGATHPNALKNLGLKFGSGDTERLRVYLGDAIEKRSTLTEALKRAPKGLLAPFEGALLKLGEETGSLDKSLRMLADWFTGQHRLLVKLWGKSAYPLFLTLFAAVALPLPLVFLGHTKQYLMIAGAGVALWWTFGGTVVYLPAKFAAGRGKWVRARLARSLTTAIEAGAPLDRALDLALAAAASPELEACVKRVPIAKRRAQPLSLTLSGCPGIPAELIAAIQVAEQTGNWSDSVGRLGQLYEDGF